MWLCMCLLTGKIQCTDFRQEKFVLNFPPFLSLQIKHTPNICQDDFTIFLGFLCSTLHVSNSESGTSEKGWVFLAVVNCVRCICRWIVVLYAFAFANTCRLSFPFAYFPLLLFCLLLVYATIQTNPPTYSHTFLLNLTYWCASSQFC